jgi:ATP-binding cassette subfamily B protein
MMIFKNLIKKHKKTIIFYIILGIVTIFLEALGIHTFQRVLDMFAEQTLTVSSVLIYGVIITVVCILWYVDNIPVSKLENGIYLDLKLMALQKMSVINFTDYQGFGIGKLIQQIENGASAGRYILLNFYFRLFCEIIPAIIISITFIALIDISLIKFILIGYIIIFVVTNIVLKQLYKIKSGILINEEFMNHYLVRGLMELVVFRTNKRYATEIKKANEAVNTIVAGKTKMRMTHEFFFTLFYFFVIILKIIVILYGLFAKTLSIGEIVALMTFLDRAYQPIAIFNVVYVQYKLEKVAFDRYKEVLLAPDDAALNQGEKIDIKRGEIEFKNVGFSYDNRIIMQNLSFVIQPNTSVAFVGESGAGKSTIIKQLTGLIKPCEGNIFIDGHDLSGMELNHFYDFISYTSQDSPVFNGTLYENIVFDRQVAEEEILRVLKLVNLYEFYQGLENGLSTQEGEKGVLLSCGERQRLALARIFFQKAKIIILDEATSAIDNITEESVMNNIMEAFKDRTLIIIAHRLSSIKKADNIFALKNGCLIEEGNFGDLINRDGYFKELWNRESRL